MPFEFECPHCHALTEVDDQYAGLEGPCFSCGQNVTMPELDDEVYQSARALLTTKRKQDFKRLLPTVGISIAIMLVLVGTGWLIKDVVLPQIGPESESAKQALARNNLRKIGNALQAYHNEYGSLPTVCVRDSAGRPLHSWRVLILPFLGEKQLYSKYRFDEPWNGPNNSLLIDEMPSCFASPFDLDSAGFGEANFLALVGKEAAFQKDGSSSLDDISDSKANTILVAEIQDSAICWLDPSDLEIRRMQFRINGDPRDEIGSHSQRGPLVLTASMEVRELRNDIEPDQLAALITIAGAESTTFEDVEQ